MEQMTEFRKQRQDYGYNPKRCGTLVEGFGQSG